MPTLNPVYKLAVSAGYKANIVKMGESAYDSLAYYKKVDFPDVEITRPQVQTDLDLLHRKALLSVNGYIHPTVYSGNRLYIPNATHSMLKSKANHIGLLSFNRLNTNLNKRPITPAMITGEDNVPLFEKAIITFEEEIDTAFLVLAGYLVFEQPEFFYRVSDRSFVLRLDRLNYVERLYELSRYRDIFDELEVPVSPNAPDVVDGGVVRSDAVVRRFLSLFNTFLVEAPNYTLSVERRYLEHSTIPGTFRTELLPTMPLVGGYGKLVEYLSKKSVEGRYKVNTADAYLNQYLFSHLPPEQIDIYNSHREVGRTYALSQAFFLNLNLTPR